MAGDRWATKQRVWVVIALIEGAAAHTQKMHISYLCGFPYFPRYYFLFPKIHLKNKKSLAMPFPDKIQRNKQARNASTPPPWGKAGHWCRIRQVHGQCGAWLGSVDRVYSSQRRGTSCWDSHVITAAGCRLDSGPVGSDSHQIDNLVL